MPLSASGCDNPGAAWLAGVATRVASASDDAPARGMWDA
jgi:hypothetical protein